MRPSDCEYPTIEWHRALHRAGVNLAPLDAAVVVHPDADRTNWKPQILLAVCEDGFGVGYDGSAVNPQPGEPGFVRMLDEAAVRAKAWVEARGANLDAALKCMNECVHHMDRISGRTKSTDPKMQKLWEQLFLAQEGIKRMRREAAMDAPGNERLG